jgi:ATP-dependent Clp protease ATP-binding subunit ClpC
MFERFTEKALRVILLAQEEARRTGHNFVGTEQLLIGLIEEGSGIASKALKESGLKLSEVRREIGKLIGKGSGFIAVEIPFTPRAKSILEQSLQQARAFNHSYIGTEHMLLALLEDTEGIAIQILTKLKVNIYKIRRALLEELGQIVDPIAVEMRRKEDEIEKKVRDFIEQDRLNKSERKKKAAEQKKKRFEKIKEYKDSLEKFEERKELKPLVNPFMFYFKYNADHLDLNYEDDEDNQDDLDDGYEEVKTIVEKIKKENVSNESREMLLDSFEEMFRKKIGESVTDTPALKEFTTNLSELALEGEIDPVIGRKKEVERVIQILSRRRKNNPILIGEPGVGKTAVAEGLALKICNQEVATCLADKEVVVLDVSSLLAGTKYRGEFEERLKRIMYEIKMKKNIILVIDEVHTIVGAGAAEGSLDAANILKPALARGELQCIGATTLDEYKQIEKDPALERRFQSVLVAEPTKDECFQILKGLRLTYENFHNVRLPNATLKASVDLSSIYIKDRFLPDKAIDLIDEAASRLKLSNLSANKEFINSVEQELRDVLQEKDFLLRSQDFEGAAKLRDREMVLRNQIRGFLYSIKASQEDIKNREKLPTVSIDEINEVLTSWTGIPLTKVGKEEAKKLLNMEKQMGKRVIGQQKAVKAICSAIQRARVGMRNPNRPIASFLFCGPTGVGKTELTKTLAENFFGSEAAMFRFDMSEYMERHTVAKLIGSPPGYVGYNEGGQLTEAVRRKPFSLILFDEVEKAHPDIFNLFLQVLDDGRLTDSKGKTIDFTNTIIIMTSNLGSKYIDSELAENKKQKNDIIKDSSLGDSIEKEPELNDVFTRLNNEKEEIDINYKDIELDIFNMNFSKSSKESENEKKYEEESDKIENLVKNEIKSFFRPEFINRIDEIIIFERLRKDHISEICDLMLKEIHKRLLEKNIFIEVDKKAKNYIIDEGYDPAYGAREVRRSLVSHLENEVTLTILKTQVITLRSIVLVEYDEYRKIHSSLYPLPSFVLSPINKDIINYEENQKAILSYIEIIKDWKKQFIRPEKYLFHYYENNDMYEETEEKEEKMVKNAKKEIKQKLEELMTQEDSKSLENLEDIDKNSKILINENKNLDD